MRILIVEDEPTLGQQLKSTLEQTGYAVDLSTDGEDGHFLGSTEDYDAVILDLGLPGIDGLTVLGMWRKEGRNFPVLVLTARDSWSDKVAGLDAGADDYLAKPFHVQELLARVNVQLRKRTLGAAQKIGEMTIDPVRRQVLWAEDEVKLSPREYELLAYLAGQPGRVYSRKEIETNVWGEDLPPSSNVVDVHIANIRGKLREVGGYGVIRTVRGVGYALKS